jgi:Na+-driven multidrug efflux pump
LGKPKEASILILIRQLVVLVPGMLIFGYFFGVEGLLYAGPVAGVVAGVLSIYDLKRETKKLKAA